MFKRRNPIERKPTKAQKIHNKKVTKIQSWGRIFISQSNAVGYFNEPTKIVLRHTLKRLKKHSEDFPRLEPFDSEQGADKFVSVVKAEQDKIQKKFKTSIGLLEKCLNDEMRMSDFNTGIKQLKSGLDLLSKYQVKVDKEYQDDADKKEIKA